MKPTQENSKYPYFEANQVLTNHHLNQAINYLDEQERLTRANLIGTGIVCGLELHDENSSITISKGLGISSDGYLITVPDKVTLQSQKNPSAELTAALANTPLADQDVWELLPDSSGTALSSVDLSNKIVIVFLALTKQKLRNCSPNNCDDKGEVIVPTLHYLLINAFEQVTTTLSELPLPRIVFSTASHLQNYEQVYRDFFSQLINGKTVLARLLTGIAKAEQLLLTYLPDLPLLDSNSANFNLPASPYLFIQYHYDFLRDLTAGYHEFIAALSATVAVCLPDNSHPQYLSLGLAKTSDNLYRHSFIPSPAVALPQQRLETLRFLHQRLLQMVKHFQVLTDTTIPLKITPSRFGFKHLSGKSLPFYYHAALKADWDKPPVLSWHDDANAPDLVRHPLLYDLEPYNLLRIEGLVGKNLLTLRTDLTSQIQQHRLPLSILYIDADASDNFLDKHPAIEHQAGALMGGTFIVLYRGATNVVLADFALPYRIETVTKNCVCRVQVKECEFEWFDSKQHLANLVKREYRYQPNQYVTTQSKEQAKNLLTSFYVIVIYRYEISGASPKALAVSLLPNNKPVQIKIPLADLMNGQLAAVAKKLNAEFPSGVIFDYNPSNNKLVIRYFAEQSFRIEWGGLQGNQIRYAYTPQNIFRWQKKTWEIINNPRYQVICRLRDEYHADEYQWLHDDQHYEAKYPSPSSAMATASELITWEKMIKHRTAVALPLSIQNLLSTIKQTIDDTFNNKNKEVVVDVFLIGSWANGSWVSRNSQENKFPSGFTALRKKITGKTGISDIDLLIDIKKPTVKLDNVIHSLSAIDTNGYKLNVVAGKKDAQKYRGISIIKQKV